MFIVVNSAGQRRTYCLICYIYRQKSAENAIIVQEQKKKYSQGGLLKVIQVNQSVKKVGKQ